MAVDRLPAGVGDELGLARAQQRLDGGGIGVAAVPARAAPEAPAPLLGRARSASIASTVSCASFLFVPITPEGPRLIQPTTYSPASGRAGVGVEDAARRRWGSSPSARRRARPAAGCRDSRSRGTARPAVIVSRSSVASRAQARRRRRRRARCGRARRRRARPCSSASSATGESRKRSTTRLRLPVGRARRRSRAGSRRCAAQVMSASASAIGDGERALELGRVDDHVGVRELAELEQLGVGEGRLRRAAAADDDDLARRWLAASTSSAWSAVSVGASSAGASTSMRATSSATLPLPITTARSAESRSTSRSVWSGWPLYQPTNSVAACEPGSSSPGMPERAVRRRAGRVDDRVVVRAAGPRARRARRR